MDTLLRAGTFDRERFCPVAGVFLGLTILVRHQKGTFVTELEALTISRSCAPQDVAANKVHPTYLARGS